MHYDEKVLANTLHTAFLGLVGSPDTVNKLLSRLFEHWRVQKHTEAKWYVEVHCNIEACEYAALCLSFVALRVETLLLRARSDTFQARRRQEKDEEDDHENR